MSESLDFFNRLAGRLKIVLSEPAKQASEQLLNLVAPKGARVVSVDLDLEVYEEEACRPLTEEEWGRVVIEAPRIRMASLDTPDTIVDHEASDGRAFTVRDLQRAISRTEQASRDDGEWMGGVDVHHVYFEGIELEDGVWSIAWGS